jgi:hypothetical protein
MTINCNSGKEGYTAPDSCGPDDNNLNSPQMARNRPNLSTEMEIERLLERKLRAESAAWVEDRLMEFFAADETYQYYSAKDLLYGVLLPYRPSNSAFVKFAARSSSYGDLYTFTNNALAKLRKRRLLVAGEKPNDSGRSVAAYAKPHDESANWEIRVVGSTDSIPRLTETLKEWLRLDGGHATESVNEVHLIRRATVNSLPGGKAGDSSKKQAAQSSAATTNKRRSRPTTSS